MFSESETVTVEQLDACINKQGGSTIVRPLSHNAIGHLNHTVKTVEVPNAFARMKVKNLKRRLSHR